MIQPLYKTRRITRSTLHNTKHTQHKTRTQHKTAGLFRLFWGAGCGCGREFSRPAVTGLCQTIATARSMVRPAVTGLCQTIDTARSMVRSAVTGLCQTDTDWTLSETGQRAPLLLFLQHHAAHHGHYTAVPVVEVLLEVHRNRRSVRDGSQDGHPHFHTAHQLWVPVAMGHRARHVSAMGHRARHVSAMGHRARHVSAWATQLDMSVPWATQLDMSVSWATELDMSVPWTTPS